MQEEMFEDIGFGTNKEASDYLVRDWGQASQPQEAGEAEDISLPREARTTMGFWLFRHELLVTIFNVSSARI
jgi:hypothetical protein